MCHSSFQHAAWCGLMVRQQCKILEAFYSLNCMLFLLKKDLFVFLSLWMSNIHAAALRVRTVWWQVYVLSNFKRQVHKQISRGTTSYTATVASAKAILLSCYSLKSMSLFVCVGLLLKHTPGLAVYISTWLKSFSVKVLLYSRFYISIWCEVKIWTYIYISKTSQAFRVW